MAPVYSQVVLDITQNALNLMAEKKYQTTWSLSFNREFIGMIDEIVAENPDFKNRTGVVKHGVRRYYDYLRSLKKV